MSKRRRLVLVANDVGGVGGMERHLEEMIDRAKKEYDLTVVARSLRLRDSSDVRFIRVPALRRPFPLMISMFSVYASLRLLFLRRDSVIHTTGAIVWCKADVSTVHFCHAGWKIASGRSGAEGSLLNRVNYRIGLWLKQWMESHCYNPRRTARLVAVSKRIERELAVSYPETTSCTTVIPNGVDTERFRPAEDGEKAQLRAQKGLPKEGTYLIFMGGDWERKGVRYVLGAFNELAEKHPDLHVLVVGQGDKQSLMGEVSEPHRCRVHFVGRQADPEVWYRLCDVFVFPSNYEACSLAVLEAAASGLTMVVTNVGGADDIVEDGKSGFFVERSRTSIALTLESLLPNPFLMKTTALEVRRRVEDMTWDHTYQQFISLYDEIAREKEVGSSGFAEIPEPITGRTLR